jgi:hypothetical protein
MSSAIEGPPVSLEGVAAWDNLLSAWRKAARGKRGTASTARFEHRAADRLLELQLELISGGYRLCSFRR